MFDSTGNCEHMAEGTVSFLLVSNYSELDRLSRIVESFGRSRQLPRKAIFALNLALDELFTNLVEHGCADGREHTARISLSCEAGMVTVDMEDDGCPFNPLSAPEPDRSSVIPPRAGGYGIHLVRRLSEMIEYRRCGGKNILRLRQRIHDEDEQEGPPEPPVPRS